MRLKVYVIGFLLLLILVVVGVFVYQRIQTPPLIVGFYPQEQLDAFTNPVTLRFNQGVQAADFQLHFTPDHAGTLHVSPEDPNELVFTPSGPFPADTQYTVTVVYKNRQLHTFSFSTPPITSEQDILEENARSVAEKYPLADFLPITTDTLKIRYVEPLTLEVQYFTDTAPTLASVSAILSEVSGKKAIEFATHTFNFVQKSN